MFSIISLICFLAFMLWMNTSGRSSRPEKNRLFLRLRAYPKASKTSAIILAGIAGYLATNLLGFGSGLFAAMFVIMGLGSVIVCLSAFSFFGSGFVFGVAFICLLFEIFLGA